MKGFTQKSLAGVSFWRTQLLAPPLRKGCSEWVVTGQRIQVVARELPAEELKSSLGTFKPALDALLCGLPSVILLGLGLGLPCQSSLPVPTVAIFHGKSLWRLEVAQLRLMLLALCTSGVREL